MAGVRRVGYRIGKLVTDPRESLSVDRSLRWIERSVVPSLAMVSASYGEAGRELLDAWIQEGRLRLSPQQLEAIREFRYAYERNGFRPGFDDEGAA